MAAKPLPSPEVLRQLLRYEPDTGRLFWKVRGVEWFKDDSQQTAKSRAKSWNSRWAGRQAFTAIDGKGYHHGTVEYRNCQAHRVIWAIMHDEWPICDIDHINCVKTDNRIINLRKATRSENKRNAGRQANNTSGFKGVSWRAEKGRWQSRIQVDGKQRHLGYFDTAADAHRAYSAAAADLHGNFARVA